MPSTKDHIIVHIEDAPWKYGGPRKPGEPRGFSSQFVGDEENGPWIYILNLQPDAKVEPHAHSQDEVFMILEGDLTMNGQRCGPGTLISTTAHKEYAFDVGHDGVRFLNIRRGSADLIMNGKVVPKENIIPK